MNVLLIDTRCQSMENDNRGGFLRNGKEADSEKLQRKRQTDWQGDGLMGRALHEF